MIRRCLPTESIRCQLHAHLKSSDNNETASEIIYLETHLGVPPHYVMSLIESELLRVLLRLRFLLSILFPIIPIGSGTLDGLYLFSMFNPPSTRTVMLFSEPFYVIQICNIGITIAPCLQNDLPLCEVFYTMEHSSTA